MYLDYALNFYLMAQGICIFFQSMKYFLSETFITFHLDIKIVESNITVIL